MKADQPSRTAERVARRRAAHQIIDEPLVFEDPLAIAVLGPEGAAALRAAPGDREDGRFARALRAFLVARSRLTEDRLALAVARGVRQYVVLGAGLDTFAYRNPYADVRVFEVDHPATQAWKRARLSEAGIAIPETQTYVSVDFQAQTLSDALPAAGFRSGEITFFSWLGVVPYVVREGVLETLRFVATIPAGSEIVFDYGQPPSALNLVQRAGVAMMARRVAAIGEPWVTWFEPSDLTAELLRLGFREAEDFGPERINALYFAGRADGLRVGGLGHVMSARV
jgi:methyltransferase (TIGR00027 family)